MASIDRFQVMQEPELKILEHWFENEDTRRRMDGMLPLDEWYARVNKDKHDTVIMAYDGQLLTGMVVIEFERSGRILIDRQSFVPTSRVRKTDTAKADDRT